MTPTCINKLPNNYIAYKSTFKFTNISFASIYAFTYSIVFHYGILHNNTIRPMHYICKQFH